MKKAYIYITGPISWFRLIPPGDAEFQRYTVSMELDAAAMEFLKPLNIKNKVRVSEDGKTSMIFSRPFSTKIGDHVVALSKPRAYDNERKPIVGDVPMLGNGSVLTLKLEVIATKRGNMVRLDSYVIHSAVKFDPAASLAKHLSENEFEEVPF